MLHHSTYPGCAWQAADCQGCRHWRCISLTCKASRGAAHGLLAGGRLTGVHLMCRIECVTSHIPKMLSMMTCPMLRPGTPLEGFDPVGCPSGKLGTITGVSSRRPWAQREGGGGEAGGPYLGSITRLIAGMPALLMLCAAAWGYTACSYQWHASL